VETFKRFGGVDAAEDVAEAILFVAGLPERVVIPELVITPAGYTYV
jgi:NADP-dependent 3-hydroxy acid dehydrogenase YdfG